MYGTQYVLTCRGCHAIIYPCDCCHQVAAHPAVSSSYSACSECGFLTLIGPQLRRLLQLPALLPLSSSTALSIQSSISLPLYQQHKTAAYQSAFTAYRRAEQSHRRQQRAAHEAKDGGESDTTDHAIRPAQPTTSTTTNKSRKQEQSDPALPKAGESTLLRLREELLAIGQLSSTCAVVPPSPTFRYGVQPLDSVPFTSHHLDNVYSTLLPFHSSCSSSSSTSSPAATSALGLLSSNTLSSFHSAAVRFFAARAELMSYIQKVEQGWKVLQRVQRTYAELDAEEAHYSANTHNQTIPEPPTTDTHTDDEADEHDEHKTDGSTNASSGAPTAGVPTATHSKAVQRGVMGIVDNVLCCRLKHTCDQLHTRAASHLPLLSAINTLLLPLYADLQAALDRGGRSGGSAAVAADVRCAERSDGDVAEAGELGMDGGGVELLLWSCWLLRCCYCGVSSVLQRAVHWSEIVNVPAQQPVVAAAAHGCAENDTTHAAEEGGTEVKQQTSSVQ